MVEGQPSGARVDVNLRGNLSLLETSLLISDSSLNEAGTFFGGAEPPFDEVRQDWKLPEDWMRLKPSFELALMLQIILLVLFHLFLALFIILIRFVSLSFYIFSFQHVTNNLIQRIVTLYI